jgi:hypothetical protein
MEKSKPTALDIVDQLRLEDSNERQSEREARIVLSALLNDAANELEAQLALLEKQQVIIRRIYAEKLPDTWFVCGESGNKDQNGLPDRIEICPAYGVDWSQIYERTDRTIGGMGS